jgi:hypothetical protein
MVTCPTLRVAPGKRWALRALASGLTAALASSLAPALAFAQSAASAASLAPAPPASAPRPLPAEPALYHVPLTTAAEREPFVVAATIDRPDLVHRAVLVVQHGGRIDEVPFQRSAMADTPYVAVVPAESVARPSIAYAIELERTDGQRVAVFASRADMQPVEVVGNEVDAGEEALVARLQGRRFVVETNGEYASFGPTTCASACAPASTLQPAAQTVNDAFWHVEAGFTYHLLRLVSEFGIRGGVYRGTSLVPGVTDPGRFNVGLNYGAPWVRLRATDWLHLEGEFLTSITEVGFSLGGGGAVLLGDEYGSHLTLGVEGADVFGTRGYSRFDLSVNRWLRVAPILEVTNQPHASGAGVRLLTDVGVSFGGWLATLRGGYQARTFDSGGPAVGGGLSYAF